MKWINFAIMIVLLTINVILLKKADKTSIQKYVLRVSLLVSGFILLLPYLKFDLSNYVLIFQNAFSVLLSGVLLFSLILVIILAVKDNRVARFVLYIISGVAICTIGILNWSFYEKPLLSIEDDRPLQSMASLTLEKSDHVVGVFSYDEIFIRQLSNPTNDSSVNYILNSHGSYIIENSFDIEFKQLLHPYKFYVIDDGLVIFNSVDLPDSITCKVISNFSNLTELVDIKKGDGIELSVHKNMEFYIVFENTSTTRVDYSLKMRFQPENGSDTSTISPQFLSTPTPTPTFLPTPAPSPGFAPSSDNLDDVSFDHVFSRVSARSD